MKLFCKGNMNRVVDEGVGAPSFDPFPMADLVTDIIDTNLEFDDEDIKDYDISFDNLVFEGGGNKGIAYIGALMVSQLHFPFNCLLSGR